MSKQTPRQTGSPQWVLLLATGGLLLLGLLLRWPALRYEGPPGPQPPGSSARSPQEQFNDYAFARFAYSDILSLYYRDGLQRQPVPYLDYRYEYPVGFAGFSYLMSFAGSPQSYYLWSYLALSLCTLLTVVLLLRQPWTRPWIFAAAPAIAIHVGVNWDALGVLPLVAAIIVARRGRLLLAGVLLALATWTKVFPVFFLGTLLVALALNRRWRDAALLLGGFAAVSLAVNLPAMLANFENWATFLTFQLEREREMNLWTLFPQLDRRQIGWIFLGLMGLGALVCSAALLPRRQDQPIERSLCAGTALLLWFYFTGKVYSPQYGLWVLVLLALLAAPPPLATIFWGIDLIYYLYSFITLALLPHSQAVGWFVEYQLIPAMLVREVALLGLTAWALWGAMGRVQREVQYAGAT